MANTARIRSAYEVDGRLNVLYEKFDQETGKASIAQDPSKA
jgi:hypothetical protein